VYAPDPPPHGDMQIASQHRDLRAAAAAEAPAPGQAGPPGALTRSELFRGRWVEDAVLRFLHRRMAAGA